MIKNEINQINTVIASLNLIDRWGGYAIHKTDSKNGIPYGVSIMKDCFGNVYTYDDRVETVGYLSVDKFTSTTQYRHFVRLPVTYTIHLFNNLAKMGEKERYWQKAILILKELKKKYTDVNIESVVTGLPDKVEYCQITIKQSYVIPCDYSYEELEDLCDGAGLITPKCIKYTVDIFTSSGTYVKPQNLETAYVMLVSGGGGGGSGRRSINPFNRGGGGSTNGIALLLKFKPQELNATEPVIVGAGGAGAPPQMSDNTSGFQGGFGGNTIFKNDCIANGGKTFPGNTIILTELSPLSNYTVLNNQYSLLNYYQNPFAIGNITIQPKHRVSDTNAIFEISLLFSNTSFGGSITATNAQLPSGGIGGFYDANNNLVGEMPGALPQSGDGQQATQYFTFGEFLNKIFHWFNPADAPQIVGRGGVGGACGDLAGTIPGGKGGDAIGYGAGGGGGGASTNGANSGAGGNGGNGIVIIINVLK